MRRRLTLAIVGVVAGALVLAGIGTLALARRAARNDARAELRQQAETIAADAEQTQRRAFVDVLRRTLRLEGFAIVRYPPVRGRLDPLPNGLDDADFDLDRLRNGDVVDGTTDGLVYAAAPITPPGRPLTIVVLVRDEPGLRAGAGYLLLAAAAALLVAFLVADRLSRRITRPLQDAEAATRRIAAGDLDARVGPDGADPELASLAHSINAMAASLARSRGLERQFLLSVSHDLRTPLTSIRGFAEAIADGTADDTRRAAEVVTAEARRLERLVQDLLDLAKLDSRRFSLELRTVDAVEVVVDTAEGFRPAAEAADLTLDIDAPDSRLDVTADPDRLAQVVANLVENALEFARTRVAVRLRAHGDDIVLDVVDDGPGIPADDLPHVFERFYRSRRTGSGLGLAIVAELVDAMGGTVHAESDDGTTMSVRLSGRSRRPGSPGPAA